MKTPRKTKTLRQPARRSPPLSLSARIERLEKAAPFPPTMASTAGRFTKLGSGGRPTSGDHVAVFDSRTGLTWSAGPLLDGKDLSHVDAMKASGPGGVVHTISIRITFIRNGAVGRDLLDIRQTIAIEV